MTNQAPSHAEALDELRKTVARRVQTYHHERRALVAPLEDTRRTVEKLIASLTESTAHRRRGRPRGATARPGPRTGAKLSAATKKKMSEAARARWAARKAVAKKND